MTIYLKEITVSFELWFDWLLYKSINGKRVILLGKLTNWIEGRVCQYVERTDSAESCCFGGIAVSEGLNRGEIQNDEQRVKLIKGKTILFVEH